MRPWYGVLYPTMRTITNCDCSSVLAQAQAQAYCTMSCSAYDTVVVYTRTPWYSYILVLHGTRLVLHGTRQGNPTLSLSLSLSAYEYSAMAGAAWDPSACGLCLTPIKALQQLLSRCAVAHGA